jgi:DNA-binding response OmpR family regulator
MRAGRQERIAELNVPEKEAKANTPLLEAPVVWTHIEGHTIETCVRTCTIRIDGILFNLSDTNCRLIECILQSGENREPFAPFEDLMQCFDHPEDDLHRSVYRHISAMRKMFQMFGLDIVSIRGQGYALVPRAHHRLKRRA